MPRRVRVTWVVDYRTVRHVWQWVTVDEDGYERFFDTKRDAIAAVAERAGR